MSSRRPFVGGNWKMNLDLARSVELAEDVTAGLGALEVELDVVLCPPHPYLQAVGHALGHHFLSLGGQDVSEFPEGAHTGQVAVSMLLDLGARWSIIGHSERRHGMHESDELVGRKVAHALGEGLGVILCCGETAAERADGATEAVTTRQITTALAGLEADRLSDLVVAYEPVWAIGTGVTPTVQDAEKVHASLRRVLSSLYHSRFATDLRIIYGGSMNSSNVSDFVASPEIDGGLIGGASLKSEDFLEICRAAGSSVAN